MSDMWKIPLFSIALGSCLQAACIAINGAQITAGDVARTNNEFAALDPSLVLSFAPIIGGRRVIPASEIEDWAARHGLTKTPYSAACFERVSRELAPEDIIEAVKTTLGSGLEDLRIDIIEICPCKVPAGRLEFPLSGASLPPDKHPETPVLWKGNVLASDRHVYPVWARVRVLAAITVVRAAKNIRPQQALSEQDMEEVKISASPVRFPQSQTLAAYEQMVANSSIEKGTILSIAMVHTPLAVERGSVVRVEIINGGARLELDAKAETGGNLGVPITLMNPAGAARFRAYVTGPGRAQLALSREPIIGEGAVLESGSSNTGSGRGF